MIRRMNINQSVKVTNDLLFLFFSQYSLISVDQWRLTQTETQLNDHRLSPRTLSLLPSFINLSWTNLSAQFSEAEEEEEEEEVIKHSPFRRSATEQTSEVKRRTDRIVQAAAALHLFCPQPFFLKKKTIRPNFPALLSVLLSCQSHPHEPRGAHWPDRHLLDSVKAQVWIPLHPSLMLQRHLSPVWKTRSDSPCRPEGCSQRHRDLSPSTRYHVMMERKLGDFKLFNYLYFCAQCILVFSKLLNIKLLRIF